MKNNELCDSSHGPSVGICLAAQTTPSGTKLQSYEFEEMLRQAWLILNSREQDAAEALSHSD